MLPNKTEFEPYFFKNESIMNEPPTSEILIVKENVAHETNQNVIGRTEIDGIANYAIHTQSGT